MEIKKEWLESLDFVYTWVAMDLSFMEMKLNNLEDKERDFVKKHNLNEEEAKAYLEKWEKKRNDIRDKIQKAREYLKPLKELKEELEKIYNNSRT